MRYVTSFLDPDQRGGSGRMYGDVVAMPCLLYTPLHRPHALRVPRCARHACTPQHDPAGLGPPICLAMVPLSRTAAMPLLRMTDRHLAARRAATSFQ